ncbi:DUF488 family protein [Candidatus Woesearchaeota archaeon]|nr:DUF488 family protein [Candidatus Woesearchaeota archaeon]
MSLFTSCILSPRKKSDGARISVMSRHTLNDGKTADPRITLAQYDEWLAIFGPPPHLIGDYYKRGLPWEGFAEQYLTYLSKGDIPHYVELLARRALEENLTVLCIEERHEHCHRRLLAEECKWHAPQLQIEHR